MENLLVPSQAETLIPARRVLVIAPHPDDEVFGCGGAILRHVAAGTPVHVRIWTTGGYGVAPGKKAAYVAARQQESVAAAGVLGYGRPDFGTGEDRQLQYGEKLVLDLLELIAACDADLVYAPSVLEMHPDHRALGMAAVEAVRRREGLRLAQYEIGIPLRPNLLLDITGVAARKLDAMQCFKSQLEKQRYDLDVAALNRYRSWTLPPAVTAAEAYLVASSAELQGDPLGLYQPEHVRQHVLGLPLDSRDLPLVTVMMRSMDRASLVNALDSVALQTYANIEVAVINATGAQHRSLGEWCGRFPLRMIEPGRALDRAAAANCALEAARGEFLIFLDDDDLFLPHHIARLVQELTSTDTAVAAYGGVIGTDQSGRETQRFDRAFDAAMLRTGNYIPIHALLFRRSALAKGARFDETLRVCEDWDFWLQLLEQGAFSHVPGIGAVYHMHSDASSGVWVNMDETRRVVLRLLKKWLSRWDDRALWSLVEFARYRTMYDELVEQQAHNQQRSMERITALESVIAKRDSVIAQQDSVVAQQGNTIAYKQTVISEREEHIGILQDDVERRADHIRQLLASLDEQILVIKQRDQHLASLLHSTSWRITAPLRSLVSFVRAAPQAPTAPAVSSSAQVQEPAPKTSSLERQNVPPAVEAALDPAPATPVQAEPVAPVQAAAEKHVYDYAVDPDAKNAANFVCELVGTGKRVLEIGCGPGSITRLLKARGQCRVTGIEVDPVSIALARPHCEAIYQQDLNLESWSQVLDSSRAFDMVVAADVLEHLYDPWRTLRQMATLIGPSGSIVVSLPHSGHSAFAACLIGNDVAYGDSGLFDRTHIRFFGMKNIEALFAQADLKIVDVRFVIMEPEQTELAGQWSQVNEFVRAALRLSKYANIYQVVVKAVPLGQPGAAVSLLSPD